MAFKNYHQLSFEKIKTYLDTSYGKEEMVYY